MKVKDAIQVIRTDLQQHRVLCFVGSGLSKPSGIPGWEQMLDRLGQQLDERAPDRAAEFVEYRQRKEFAKAGEIYKRSPLFDADKQSLFDDLFLRDKNPSAVHKILVGLGFEGILTTNYDRLIEDAYATVKGRSIRAYLPQDLSASDLELRGFFLAKLHGDASNWRTVVLGLDDYRHATWPASVAPLLVDRTLLVLGFGGRDHLINQLLLNAERSHVHVVMATREANHYHDFLVSTCGQVPQHIQIVPIEHNAIESFLDKLRPHAPIVKVLDSPWGRMPPHPVAMEYPQATQELMNFYASNARIACLVAGSSSGLSSFVACEAERLSQRHDIIVCRIEGKRWLPLQAYALHLLASPPPQVYEEYLVRRRAEVGGWDHIREAEAIAGALASLDDPVLIFHEHADRLSTTAIEFWNCLVAAAGARFKVVFCRPSGLIDHDIVQIDLGRPTEYSIVSLCAFYSGDHEKGTFIAKALPNRDLQTLVLASCLSGSDSFSKDEIIRRAIAGGSRGLFTAALEVLVRDNVSNVAVQLLKACTVFRTQRNVEALSECSQLTEPEVLKGLQTLCRLGFLIPPQVGQIEAYAMSTTGRAIINDILPWQGDDRQAFNLRAADYFKRISLDALEKNDNRCERDVILAVPVVSSALFHYAEARNPDTYVRVICQMRPYLQNMCHFSILDEWIDNKAMSLNSCILTPRSRFDLAYSKARLARVKSIAAEFEMELATAQSAIAEIKANGQECTSDEADLRFENGILLTMQRRYPEALQVFEAEYKHRPNLKNLERVIQTLLSLGRLRSAERTLRNLWKELDTQRKRRGEERLIHDFAMAYRHESTLCTLRLMLYDHRPEKCKQDQESLFRRAVYAADKCREHSEKTGPSASRHTVSDKTGLGIAALKLAQAHYAARDYPKAVQYSLEGVGLLAGFPNSRWWRMCCHDLAARGFAMQHKIAEGEQQLGYAFRAFEDSGKDDFVRLCELRRTEGLLALAMGDGERAIELLKKSLDFRTRYHRVSPCIEIALLCDLAQAQLSVGKLKDAGITLRRALRVDIEW